MRLILASKSPARRAVLRAAGLHPEVLVSGFDEHAVRDAVPARLACRLAEAKASVVVPQVEGDAIIIACDSVLEFEGRAHGKPGTRAAAIERWQAMRGREGLLHTGHHVVVQRDGTTTGQTRLGTTTVRFADLDDEEIGAYVDTGEPLRVAGGFTIDGIGGAYVTAIDGDPYNVVGLSLPIVRQMIIDAGVRWESLWRRH
ncbi:MAG: septum formation inhibitor Maf [Tessaracoccus sp.]|uniref:Maf family protein n=1 Tax=Tessaracoccus sp. TaxID=1971211 RepID=UPI001EBBA5B7|nr:Maf family protein [Tessaracoccus sp.]MBK7821644.1 septum formation inhibitor Maf [Tessaracoccus sp.]